MKGSRERISWEPKSTAELDKELASSKGLTEFLQKNNAEFQVKDVEEVLLSLLKERNITKADLAKRSGMSEVYLYQILNGRRTPSRDRMLCLCFGFSCSLEETQEILRKCRYVQLYARVRRDAVIMYALSHGWDLEELNDNLYQIEEETMF